MLASEFDGFLIEVPGSPAALLQRITTGNTGEYRRGLEVIVYIGKNGVPAERCNALAGPLQRLGDTDATPRRERCNARGLATALPCPSVSQIKTMT
jgi:hypothetical protein